MQAYQPQPQFDARAARTREQLLAIKPWSKLKRGQRGIQYNAFSRSLLAGEITDKSIAMNFLKVPEEPIALTIVGQLLRNNRQGNVFNKQWGSAQLIRSGCGMRWLDCFREYWLRMTSKHPQLPQDLEADILALIHDLADSSRAIAHDLFRTDRLETEDKEDESPVTIADKRIETAWREQISAKFPDHGILGEEFDENWRRSCPVGPRPHRWHPAICLRHALLLADRRYGADDDPLTDASIFPATGGAPGLAHRRQQAP